MGSADGPAQSAVVRKHKHIGAERVQVPATVDAVGHQKVSRMKGGHASASRTHTDINALPL